MQQRNGYVIVLTLIILSAAIVITTQLYHKISWYNTYVPIVLQKEQAAQLAFSGISIAIAQLAGDDKSFSKKIGQDSSEKKTKEDPKKILLRTILSIQNRWQVFKLNEKDDGIDGEIGIYLACEDGKININSLYNFEKKDFNPTIPPEENKKKSEETVVVKEDKKWSARNFLQEIATVFKSRGEKEDLVQSLEESLKKHNEPLPESTLLLVGELATLFAGSVFYESITQKGAEKEISNIPKVYFTDLFTVETNPSSFENMVNPLMFSSSVRILFDIYGNGTKAMQQIDEKTIEKMIEKLPLDNLSWEKNWDIYLKPFYGKEWKDLAKNLKQCLGSQFEPSVFSVVCYGTIGHLRQKLYAIIIRRAVENGYEFVVKKVYWL